jgi:hypothetical protein
MKPKICLNMIVKNEGKIITEMLESIYKYLDYYIINDTGSTDDTREVITDFFNSKNIKGEIIDHEFRTCTCHDASYKRYKWFHFGWNRTFALQQCYGKGDYIWIIDADDILIGNLNLDNLKEDSYQLKYGNDFVFYRPQIIKNDKNINWRYECGLHEYLTSEKTINGVILEGEYYMFPRTIGGDRNQDAQKYIKDAQVFEELLSEEPKNERYLFYCAQSYRDAQMWQEAIKYYKKRIKCGGWYEEVYFSYYRIGLCLQQLGRSENEIVTAFLDAYNYYPNRVEPLYEIITLYRRINKFIEGYKYVNKAIKIKLPTDDVLFISYDVYNYKLFDEAGLCAYNIGNMEEAYNLWNKILKTGKCPDSELERINRNINFALQYLSENNKILNDTTLNNKKEIICFYLDDIVNYNSQLDNIIKILSITYQIYIFSKNSVLNKVNDHYFCNTSSLSSFKSKNKIEYIILIDNINYFLEHSIDCKICLFLQNIIIRASHGDLNLLDNGKNFFDNIKNKISNIIVLTNLQKNKLQEIYNFDGIKVSIIDYSIENNLSITNNIKNKKILYKFYNNKELDNFIKTFELSKIKFSNLELYLFEDIENKDTILDLQSDYIHNLGKINKVELLNNYIDSDILILTDANNKNTRMEILEAQSCSCVCFCNSNIYIQNILENKGIILKENIESQDYQNEIYEKIDFILDDNNNFIKEFIIEKSLENIKKYNQDNIILLWNTALKK